MPAATKTFLEEHRGQKQGANKGTRNAAEKNRQVGIRKRAAKAALDSVRTASRGVTPPQGVWRLNHGSHAALRLEIEYLYTVNAAESRLAAALDDVPQAAFHDGRASAFIWALAALDALEALTKGNRREK